MLRWSLLFALALFGCNGDPLVDPHDGVVGIDLTVRPHGDFSVSSCRVAQIGFVANAADLQSAARVCDGKGTFIYTAVITRRTGQSRLTNSPHPGHMHTRLA